MAANAVPWQDVQAVRRDNVRAATILRMLSSAGMRARFSRSSEAARPNFSVGPQTALSRASGTQADGNRKRDDIGE